MWHLVRLLLRTDSIDHNCSTTTGAVYILRHPPGRSIRLLVTADSFDVLRGPSSFCFPNRVNTTEPRTDVHVQLLFSRRIRRSNHLVSVQRSFANLRAFCGSAVATRRGLYPAPSQTFAVYFRSASRRAISLHGHFPADAGRAQEARAPSLWTRR